MRDFDQEIFDSIIERIEIGESVISAVKSDGNRIARSTLYQWIDADKVCADRYARALASRAERMFEELIEISDDGRRDYTADDDGREVINHDHIQRSRLRVDTRKWMLSKMLPKKYGEKIETTVQGADGDAIKIVTRIERVIIDNAANPDS